MKTTQQPFLKQFTDTSASDDHAIWTLRDTLIGAGLTLLPFISLALLNTGTGSATTTQSITDSLYAVLTLIFNSAIEAVFLIAPFYYAWRRGFRLGNAGLGFRSFHLPLALGLMMLSVMVAIISGYVITEIATLLHMTLHTNADDLQKAFGQHYPWTLRATLAVAIVVAPVSEEAFFRGFVLQGLRTRMNNPLAIVVSSLIFAIIHFSPGSFFQLFTLSVMLGVLRVYTRSLWPGIMLHTANNLLSAVSLLLGL